MRRIDSTYDRRERYVLHVMAALVASLLVVIAAVRWWPLPSDDAPPGMVFDVRGQEVITLEEVVPTRQQMRRPPPPAPLVPVVVPDEVVLEEYDLELVDNYLPVEDPGDDETFVEGDVVGTQATMASAEVGPKPVRIVEPEYTKDARKKKIRAEVVIEVLVNARGRVEQARILERYLLGKKKTDPKKLVPTLGFGLEEAALAAAEGWMFRPARQNGKPVRSFFVFTLSFGI